MSKKHISNFVVQYLLPVISLEKAKYMYELLLPKHV